MDGNTASEDVVGRAEARPLGARPRRSFEDALPVEAPSANIPASNVSVVHHYHHYHCHQSDGVPSPCGPAEVSSSHASRVAGLRPSLRVSSSGSEGERPRPSPVSAPPSYEEAVQGRGCHRSAPGAGSRYHSPARSVWEPADVYSPARHRSRVSFRQRSPRSPSISPPPHSARTYAVRSPSVVRASAGSTPGARRRLALEQYSRRFQPAGASPASGGALQQELGHFGDLSISAPNDSDDQGSSHSDTSGSSDSLPGLVSTTPSSPAESRSSSVSGEDAQEVAKAKRILRAVLLRALLKVRDAALALGEDEARNRFVSVCIEDAAMESKMEVNVAWFWIFGTPWTSFWPLYEGPRQAIVDMISEADAQ